MRQMTDQNIEWGKWLGGAAAGALVMYMLDPERGALRRAQSGERLRELGRQTGGAVGRAVRHIGEGRAEEPVKGSEPSYRSDLEQRTADAGHDMGATASSVLQAAQTQLGGNWSPGARSAAVVGGGALGLYALATRSPLAMLAGLAGLTLLARGASNQPLTSLMSTRGRTVDVARSIHIDASPEQVYELWSNYENFPHFLSNVVEVRDLGNRRSHWVVKGPAGSEFQFNSVLTEQSRPRRLAWRSEPGSEIKQSGSVEFHPSHGGTHVTVHMSYVPPAGGVGHGLATMLGSDPEHQLDEDLLRMKSVIERGTLPSGASRQGGSQRRFLH